MAFPSHDLPVELLSTIFSEVYQSTSGNPIHFPVPLRREGSAVINPLPSAWALTRVCRRWRSVAITTRSLWSWIHFTLNDLPTLDRFADFLVVYGIRRGNLRVYFAETIASVDVPRVVTSLLNVCGDRFSLIEYHIKSDTATISSSPWPFELVATPAMSLRCLVLNIDIDIQPSNPSSESDSDVTAPAVNTTNATTHKLVPRFGLCTPTHQAECLAASTFPNLLEFRYKGSHRQPIDFSSWFNLPWCYLSRIDLVNISLPLSSLFALLRVTSSNLKYLHIDSFKDTGGGIPDTCTNDSDVLILPILETLTLKGSNAKSFNRLIPSIHLTNIKSISFLKRTPLSFYCPPNSLWSPFLLRHNGGIHHHHHHHHHHKLKHFESQLHICSADVDTLFRTMTELEVVVLPCSVLPLVVRTGIGCGELGKRLRGLGCWVKDGRALEGVLEMLWDRRRRRIQSSTSTTSMVEQGDFFRKPDLLGFEPSSWLEIVELSFSSDKVQAELRLKGVRDSIKALEGEGLEVRMKKWVN